MSFGSIKQEDEITCRVAWVKTNKETNNTYYDCKKPNEIKLPDVVAERLSLVRIQI
jgi:hypothetical protein